MHRLGINSGEGLGVCFLALGVDQSCGRGPRGAGWHQVQLVSQPSGPRPSLPCPLAFLLLNLMDFHQNFLQSHTSLGTSGTRSFVSKICYLCVLPSLWWDLMVKHGVYIVTINNQFVKNKDGPCFCLDSHGIESR